MTTVINTEEKELPNGVSKRKDGRYMYRVYRDGKTYYLYNKDLAILNKMIEEFKLKMNLGLNFEKGQMTLAEYYPFYLESYKKGKIKQASYNNKVSAFKNYIAPYNIANIPIRNITRGMIISHFQSIADKKGLSANTLGYTASSLKCAVDEIVFDGGLLNNPFTDVIKYVSAKGSTAIVALERYEQNELISYLRKPGFQNTYLPIIGTLIGTGVRIGEATALTWDDIDFKNKSINVNKSLNYRDRGNGCKEYYITTPKTSCSIRILPMSTEVYELLVLQKKRQKEQNITQNFSINEYDNNGRIVEKYSGFVFTTKKGMPYSDGLVSNFKRIVEHHNEEEFMIAEKEGRDPILLPKLRAHILRHTFCTRIVEAQVRAGVTNFQAIKNLMGHSRIETSINVYTNITKEMYNLVANEVEGIL